VPSDKEVEEINRVCVVVEPLPPNPPMKCTKSKRPIGGTVRNCFLMAPRGEKTGPLVTHCYWTVTVTSVVCWTAPEVAVTVTV
jgi:hypothetical protein